MMLFHGMMRPFGHRSCTQNTWNIIAGDYFWIHLQAKTKYLWDVMGLFDTTCSETTTKAVKQLMITKTWTSFTKHHQTVLFSVILPQLDVEGKNDLATRWHLWEALPASWGKHDFLESQDWLGKKQYQSNIVYKIWKHMIQLVHDHRLQWLVHKELYNIQSEICTRKNVELHDD